LNKTWRLAADDISFQKNKVISVDEIMRQTATTLRLEPLGIGCTSIPWNFFFSSCVKEIVLQRANGNSSYWRKNFGDLAHRNMEKIAS